MAIHMDKSTAARDDWDEILKKAVTSNDSPDFVENDFDKAEWQ
jgi:hypothetical protein